MPTYDYRCKACGHALELFHSMTEAPKKRCPRCGKNQLERKIGAGAGFVFKGSGFYSTDYRSKDYERAAKAEQSSTTTEAKPSEAKAGDANASAPKPDPKSSDTKTSDGKKPRAPSGNSKTAKKRSTKG